MKQNDIALLILIVAVAVIGSSLIGSKVIRPTSDRKAKVEVVEKFSSTFPNPDPTVFNDKALNPTKEIHIGNDNSSQPIGTTSK